MSNFVMDQKWNGSFSTSSVCPHMFLGKEVEPKSTGLQCNNTRFPFINTLNLTNRVTQTAILSVMYGLTLSASVTPANATNLPGLFASAPEQISSTSSKSQTREESRNALINKIYALKNASWVMEEDRLALENTVMDVSTFLQIIPGNIPLPELTYTDDGEILLFWNMSREHRAELSFSSEFGNGYALYISSRFEPGKEELISSKFPADLLNYLKS